MNSKHLHLHTHNINTLLLIKKLKKQEKRMNVIFSLTDNVAGVGLSREWRIQTSEREASREESIELILVSIPGLGASLWSGKRYIVGMLNSKFGFSWIPVRLTDSLSAGA